MRSIDFEFLFGKIYVTAAMTRVTVSYVFDEETLIISNQSVDCIEFDGDINFLDKEEQEEKINEALENFAVCEIHDKLILNCGLLH